MLFTCFCRLQTCCLDTVCFCRGEDGILVIGCASDVTVSNITVAMPMLLIITKASSKLVLVVSVDR